TQALAESDRGLDLRPTGDGANATVAVSADRPLHQAIVDPADGLNAIAVRLAEPLPTPATDIQLIVRDAADGGELARGTLSSDSASDGWLRFTFKAQRGSARR